MNNIDSALEAIAKQQAATSFSSAEDEEREGLEDAALGIAIAGFVEWDCERALEIAAHILQAANVKHEAEVCFKGFRQLEKFRVDGGG